MSVIKVHTSSKLRKLGLTFSLWVFFAGVCPAVEVRRSPLHRGVAPGDNLEVTVVEVAKAHTERSKICYQLRNRRTHRLLATVLSTYQSHPEAHDGGSDHWWDVAESTDVFWNRDASLAAIDEYPIQHGGHVRLVAVVGRNQARVLVVPENQLLRRTGFKWNRVRIRVRSSPPGSGWIDDRQLCLTIGGYPASKIGETRSASNYPDTEFTAIAKVMDNLRVHIISVRPN